MASYGSQRLIELVKRLVIATANERIEWQQTDDPTGFVCVFDGPSVQIRSEDADGAYPYILQVMDNYGNVIESFRSNGRDPWDEDDSMAELYERARRSATNVDDIIDTILSDLPPLPPQPPQAMRQFSDEPPF